MANFRTKARAIDLLGKNQIADLPTAITELWKNGYDAYGDYLSASLFLPGYGDIQKPIFMLSDDGYGMNSDDIVDKWLVLATSGKVENREILPEERFFKPLRVSYGEKGIGRLSVAYLGNFMMLITKKPHEKVNLLLVDWQLLINHELYIDDVNIPIINETSVESIQEDFKKMLKELLNNFAHESWKEFSEVEASIRDNASKYERIPETIKKEISRRFSREEDHGTLFLVFDPIDQLCNMKYGVSWDDTKEDRDVKENLYIISTISGLFNPFDPKVEECRKAILGEDLSVSPTFYICDENGKRNCLSYPAFFSEDEFENCEHWIDGEFDEKGHFSGKIKVFGKEEDYSYNKNRRNYSVGKMRLRLAFWEAQPAYSSMPREMWDSYEEKGKFYGGLYVYRDGIRVLPYGRTDFDFLEFENRRTKHAGNYYFSHRKMIGYIGITKFGNPGLIDKAGREGFVANDSYNAMKRVLVDFFVTIAKEKYGSLSDERQRYIVDKKDEIEKNKRLVEEKRQNTIAVYELRKKMSDIASQLEVQKSVIDDLESQIPQSGELAKSLFQRIDRVKNELEKLSMVVPENVSLAGADDVSDLLADNMELHQTLLNRINRMYEAEFAFLENDAMQKYYSGKIEEIDVDFCDSLQQINTIVKESINHLSDSLNQAIEEKKALHEHIMSEPAVDMINKLESLRKEAKDLSDELSAFFVPVAEWINGISFSEKTGILLSDYKAKVYELENLVGRFYSLAQVGMSMEIASHQFSEMYDNFNEWLDELKNECESNEKLKPIYKGLLLDFMHIAENHEMLMPAYRPLQRVRVEITGQDINDIVEQFYKKDFEAKGIDFSISESFRSYSIFSFSPIVIPVYLNVIHNAIYWVDYGKDQQQKKIYIDYVDSKVTISNTGKKMNSSELSRCFEMGYTKRKNGRGVGLYLAKVNLRSINMDIFATNDSKYNRLGGACFVISEQNAE